jgi:alkylhydroperoxidase family enzyme
MDASLSAAEMLNNAARLDAQTLDQFVQKLIALRARRKLDSLDVQESVLLEKINRGLPAEQLQRFLRLQERREAETLTEAEHIELMALIAAIEQLDAERVHNLGELAHLRKIPVRQLMRELGIFPEKPYA